MVGAVAALWPAVRLSRMTTLEGLRHEVASSLAVRREIAESRGETGASREDPTPHAVR
ncbi:MAG: hypothetical protein MRJ92_02735 [Nitrospira sp.]|nr:hypothetical protein [Nitrospira sp.]